jgi:sterol desaturase/sphingolipid hydroxylase (fatty acid hydroxylase superfamily)
MSIYDLPDPIDIVLDPISLTIIASYAGLMLWEAIAPARKLPIVKGWKTRTTFSFTVYFFLSSYLPIIWDQYLAPYQLLDLSGLGIITGALVGIFVYELGAYVWHRSMHRSTLLWRGFHQMHHSAERLDTWGAFYFSPLDMLGWTVLSSLSLVLLVGIPAQAVTIFLLVTTFLAIFQHANIRTPQWLGYLIQRPESHSVHHGRHHHADNYADLPVFDILFGTFKNPKIFESETGFYPGASERLVDMVLFKDVSEPTTATGRVSALN